MKEYIDQFIRPKQKQYLFDYFAGQAPNEIPPWFEPEPLHDSKPQQQTDAYKFSKLNDPTGEHGMYQRLCEWLKDPCFDFEERMIERKFQDLIEDYYTDLAIWQNNNQIARYFKWRYYYAQQMLKERKKWIGGQREEEKEKTQES